MNDPVAWIRKRETSTVNAKRATVFMNAALKAGKKPLYAYDCSGLIVKFLQDNGLVKNDMSSQSLYNACGKLKREELTPGDLVFRHSGEKIYHVGVYLGGGKAAEAKGRSDGVVVRDMDASGASYWNRYGRLPLLDK